MALHNSILRKNVRMQGGGYRSLRPRTIRPPSFDHHDRDFGQLALADGHELLRRRGLPSSAALSRSSQASTSSSVPQAPVTRKTSVTLDASELSDGQILGLLQLYASENIANHGAQNGALLRRISQDPTRWPEWVDQVNAGLYKVGYMRRKFAGDPTVYDFNLVQGYKIEDLLDEIQLRSVNNPALSKGAGSSGLGQNALLYGGLGLAALLAYQRFSKKK